MNNPRHFITAEQFWHINILETQCGIFD